jgi:hypothetical protein
LSSSPPLEKVSSWSVVVFWWVWGRGTESFDDRLDDRGGMNTREKGNSLESLHYAQDIVSITSIASMAGAQAQATCKHTGALPW